MTYIDQYKQIIIPSLKLEGLYEQKKLFEEDLHPEGRVIYKAICRRILDLKRGCKERKQPLQC
jgi:hypothetical protein